MLPGSSPSKYYIYRINQVFFLTTCAFDQLSSYLFKNTKRIWILKSPKSINTVCTIIPAQYSKRDNLMGHFFHLYSKQQQKNQAIPNETFNGKGYFSMPVSLVILLWKNFGTKKNLKQKIDCQKRISKSPKNYLVSLCSTWSLKYLLYCSPISHANVLIFYTFDVPFYI